MGYGTPEVIN